VPLRVSQEHMESSQNKEDTSEELVIVKQEVATLKHLMNAKTIVLNQRTQQLDLAKVRDSSPRSFII